MTLEAAILELAAAVRANTDAINMQAKLPNAKADAARSQDADAYATRQAAARTQEDSTQAATATSASPSNPPYVDVSKAIQVASRGAQGSDGVRVILAKFGAKTGKDLKPEQYADVIAALSHER